MDGGPLLLIGVVVAVGVLHTIVPDRWPPIALLVRQPGWSRRETGWAGPGRVRVVVSTLLIGFTVWLAGASQRRDLARWSPRVERARSAG